MIGLVQPKLFFIKYLLFYYFCIKMFTLYIFIAVFVLSGGRTLIEISGSLIWSKTLMELIFNPCGEFRWSPEGPVSQIHSNHLQAGAPETFSDILMSVQMLKRERGSLKQREATAPIHSSVCGGRPAFEQNCNLGSWICSEGPALVKSTMTMFCLSSFNVMPEESNKDKC